MAEQRTVDFEELWSRHHRDVYAYALRRTDRSGAQDAVAETFLVAWRRRDDIPRRALPWLLGVARLVLKNIDRADRRREALAGVLIQHAQIYAEPGEPVDHDLLSALSTLKSDDREAIMLVAWDGLRPSEAAAAVGCTAAAFRVRLLRARRRLRAALDAVPHAAGATPTTTEVVR